MSEQINITKGMTLFYKMKSGERIFKRLVKDISPNSKCFLVEESPDAKGELWLAVTNVEILDNTP